MSKFYILYHLALEVLGWIFMIISMRKIFPEIKQHFSGNTNLLFKGMWLGIIIFLIDTVWSIYILLNPSS